MRAALVTTTAVPARRNAVRPRYGMPDFRELLGDAVWGALPAAVRVRFGPAAERCERIYPGVMAVGANAAGRRLAQLLRLFGTPFAPWTAERVDVVVRVAPAPGGGLVWERTYSFDGHEPVRVSSRKMQTRGGELLELVTGGLGMRVALSVDRGDLVFRSTSYVWKLGPWLMPLPAFLCPGEAVVIHRDLGAGRFAFIMTFTHPLAGELFFQSGVFEDPVP